MIARLLSTAAFAALLATAASAQTVVPVGHFDSVELRGGGHVTFHYGAQQRVTLVKGSTQYTGFAIRDGRKLVIDACNGDCPMVYDLDIEITTPDIGAVAVKGGGHIDVAPGFPAQDRIVAAVDGGGHIDTRNIDAESATAAVDGGGKIEIRAEKGLTASVDGGGRIRYAGHPAVTTAIDGGGSVEREGG
jgi:Putative auto-transporter adhesin, head GIN domain